MYVACISFWTLFDDRFGSVQVLACHDPIRWQLRHLKTSPTCHCQPYTCGKCMCHHCPWKPAKASRLQPLQVSGRLCRALGWTLCQPWDAYTPPNNTSMWSQQPNAHSWTDNARNSCAWPGYRRNNWQPYLGHTLVQCICSLAPTSFP